MPDLTGRLATGSAGRSSPLLTPARLRHTRSVEGGSYLAGREVQMRPDPSDAYRFYDDFASWWPLISPPADYAEEAAFISTLFRSPDLAVRKVLELGSGGGSNAFHLRSSFAMTLVDLSGAMLDVSRALNPDCTHHHGDMRTVRLDEDFDCVFVHDAVDYMVDETSLRSAIKTAFWHCRPGGVAVFVPDSTRQTFNPETDHGGIDGADGRAVRYLSWTWDPDPADSWTLTEYAFVFRDPDGTIRVAHETHRTGLFDESDWLRLLAETGFDATVVTEVTTEVRTPRSIFVGHRPLS